MKTAGSPTTKSRSARLLSGIRALGGRGLNSSEIRNLERVTLPATAPTLR